MLLRPPDAAAGDRWQCTRVRSIVSGTRRWDASHTQVGGRLLLAGGSPYCRGEQFNVQLMHETCNMSYAQYGPTTCFIARATARSAALESVFFPPLSAFSRGCFKARPTPTSFFPQRPAPTRFFPPRTVFKACLSRLAAGTTP